MSPYPLRILFVTPHYKPYMGGTERLVEQFTKQYAAREEVEQIGILTSHYEVPIRKMKGLKDKETIDKGVMVYRVSGTPAPLPSFLSLLPEIYRPGTFADVLSDFKPNVIHLICDCWTYPNLLMTYLKPRGAVVVFTLSYHPIPWWKVRKKMGNFVITQRSDVVTAVSLREKQEIETNYHISPEKIYKQAWGVNQMGISVKKTNPITVLSVGRVGGHKNQRFLIKAWIKARPFFQKKARLLVVGRDKGGEDGMSALKKVVKRHSLDTEILFTGEVEDKMLRRLYQTSHIYALFSRYESFGLSYLEAMSAGLPVITWENDVTREILAKGAILTKRNSIPDAVKALTMLVNTETKREILGREAFEHARGYTWDTVAEKFLRLYQYHLEKKNYDLRLTELYQAI